MWWVGLLSVNDLVVHICVYSDLKFEYDVESGVNEVDINVYDGNKPEPREAIARITSVSSSFF